MDGKKNIVEAFIDMYETGLYSDFNLIINRHIFKLHKAILKNRGSKFLDDLYEYDNKHVIRKSIDYGLCFTEHKKLKH